MPASKPSTIACQSEPRQSLRQRAASLRAAAARYTSLTPTNLAEACAWATAHRVWLDEGQNLGDAGLDIELQRIDTVFDRATSEPSRSPCETIAKARMLLDDLHRSGSLSASSDHRLIPVVLQELLALADTIAADRGASAATEGHGLPDVRFGPLGFDASAKSLETLQSLHGVASVLNAMCDALLCQPRCTAKPLAARSELNAAGWFVSWLIGVTDGLLDHVRRVARERVPSDSWDRERRLNIIARSTIENGDKAETLALVADLTAYAASDL